MKHSWFDVTEIVSDPVSHTKSQIFLSDSCLVRLLQYSESSLCKACSFYALMCFSLILSVLLHSVAPFWSEPTESNSSFCFSRHPGNIWFDCWAGSGLSTLNTKDNAAPQSDSNYRLGESQVQLHRETVFVGLAHRLDVLILCVKRSSGQNTGVKVDTVVWCWHMTHF